MEFVLVFIAVLILLAFYIWSQTPSRPKNYPPGPRAYPFVGNILSLGKQPQVAMMKWKEVYGDVYSIFSGRKPMVILSNLDIVRKVFGEDSVSGRDDRSAVRVDPATLAHGENGLVEHGLVFSQGDLWKTHRRFAMSTLKDLGMGKNWMEDSIIKEVEGLCLFLKNTNKKPFNPKVQISNSISNIMCALIFGERFSLTDPDFSHLTSLITENIDSMAVNALAQALPFLMWFPNGVQTRILRARRNVVSTMNFLKERIKNHANVTYKQAEAQDYLYAYQKEMESASNQDTFNGKQLDASLFDLFFGGAESACMTTLFAFVFMIENPDVVKKVQEEIDTNVENGRMLTNADRAFLPFTEAFIMEVQRCASVVPLGLPHRTREEITVEGYTLPKNTLVAANFFSIHQDPRWWKNPEEFNPIRFLDENSKLIRPEAFAPFSVGKRVCMAEPLARMELFLYLGNLMRCFTVQLPPGKIVSREDYTSSIVDAPIPFEMVFVPRI